jgi:hypothetical protein
MPISSSVATSARNSHSAVWTGSEMIVFGGFDTFPVYYNDTLSYVPSRLLYLYQRP